MYNENLYNLDYLNDYLNKDIGLSVFNNDLTDLDLFIDEVYEDILIELKVLGFFKNTNKLTKKKIIIDILKLLRDLKIEINFFFNIGTLNCDNGLLLEPFVENLIFLKKNKLGISELNFSLELFNFSAFF